MRKKVQYPLKSNQAGKTAALWKFCKQNLPERERVGAALFVFETIQDSEKCSVS